MKITKVAIQKVINSVSFTYKVYCG